MTHRSASLCGRKTCGVRYEEVGVPLECLASDFQQRV